MKYMSSDSSRTSLHPSQIHSFSWGTRGKPWDTTSTTAKRAKCLSLGMESSLRKSLSDGKSVGGRCDSRRFESDSGASQTREQVGYCIGCGVGEAPSPRRSARL